MWVLTVGPFRGKRMRTARLVGLIALLALLAALAWQVLDAILEPPQVPEQPTSGTTIIGEQATHQSIFQRIITHLRNWYKDGF
ncbi:MAG: hypothetical protein FD169_1363 [Bacillota bacterium]|nr:MAG: hypothetical protein FD169_1363 [Bacillota bacterium]MBS3950354.1 hypothetical protein [Peptococcaceae bacterium]